LKDISDSRDTYEEENDDDGFENKSLKGSMSIKANNIMNHDNDDHGDEEDYEEEGEEENVSMGFSNEDMDVDMDLLDQDEYEEDEDDNEEFSIEEDEYEEDGEEDEEEDDDDDEEDDHDYDAEDIEIEIKDNNELKTNDKDNHPDKALSSSNYIPPHLRASASKCDQNEQQIKLKRQAHGLLNRYCKNELTHSLSVSFSFLFPLTDYHKIN